MPMRDRFMRGVGLMLVVSLLAARPAQSTALRQSQDPEPTPPPALVVAAQPTSGGRIPPGPTSSTVFPLTAAPTNTLEPAPTGGGRVAVDALYVRDEPKFDSSVIGLVGYGTAVFPVGRNANTTWVAINWGDSRGWLYKDFILWDPEASLEDLEVLAPANLTPFPSDTPDTGAGSATAVTPSPVATPTVEATDTPESESTSTPTDHPTPSTTPSETSVPPSATPTEAVAGVATQPPAPSIFETLPPEVTTGGGIALGVIILGAILYLWRRTAANRELDRYRAEFVLSLCPVCLEGHVQLDEVVKHSLGIPRVSRSARCDNCRSVLRQIKPGEWRYSVDSYANPDFAKQFGKRNLTDAELSELSEKATAGRFELELEREQTLKSQMDLSWLEVEYDDPPDDSDGDGSAPSRAEDEAQASEEDES
jgi:SH3 domain-containing protein